ncbi:uroporphyrinogen-III C-methyltransferase [Streptococcus cuniculi]|uniref:Uroporphyrinogen-III C-methyltransferase n=1 Tax=Streptococcus cuniculi TaxID=1432788 RepID=A0A4Y9JCD6_9STRE|nr:uroporphyrinogen-III C-methyltransferase [Streptococcus cuniculi]MBF0777640.1 uroporphyrinogen-III C-methyltransferase [Streptococcus cuniculi]TFU98680.1 uroporphyrinogen-III C-methyltransferase [Streptococcus cuniculi]
MTGLVTLLGAGPGDYELLTLKGLRRLKEADVLVFDRLVNPQLFQAVKADCEKIDVGKQPGMPCVRQEEIENILIKKAQEGKRVIRLKSGDPYVFGRGGEEATALVKADVAFEVIPGITSAIAGLTYAGVPMTYRDVATSFHVFTGHLKDETEALNWEAISQLKGTLVFLMGMKNLTTITHELATRSFDKDTPVAIVEWGTHPQQRSVDGTLETIVSLVEEHQFKAPSIIVVGDVVAFRKELNFHEQLPLFGRKILIQDSPTGKLPRLLKDAGASLVTFPARNQVKKLPLGLPDMEQVDGILVADMQSWPLFVAALRDKGMDIRQLAHIKIAAIGMHTAKGLEESGIFLHQKGTQISDSQLSAAMKEETGNWYILAPQHKKDELASYYHFPILETHQVGFDSPLLSQEWAGVEAICLPNSVAAMNFVALSEESGQDWKEVPIIVMGSSTREVLENAGFTAIIEADEPTIASICDKCQAVLG